MAHISTLVHDIQETLEGKGDWNEKVSEDFQRAMDNLMHSRLNPEEGTRKGTIRMSNVGQPCSRKLWYHVNSTEDAEPLPVHTRLKFLYGDVIEELLLSLAEASGHDVVGRQDEMHIGKIKGHRDAVIDGMLIDVKSASTRSMEKFQDNGLLKEDNFGYRYQLAAYLLASQDDPLVTYKTEAGFLAMDKQFGHVVLDIYNLEEEMAEVSRMIHERTAMVGKGTPPPRSFDDVPYQASGNRKLDTVCSYCDHKKNCWPGVKGFMTGKSPVWLTKIVRHPTNRDGTPKQLF